MEDGKVTGVIIYLGHYESEFDWSNTTQAEKVNCSVYWQVTTNVF